MINDSFDWSDLLNCVVFNTNTTLPQNLPKIEAKDGQEPTAESQRVEARQADAREKSEKPRNLTAHDRKAFDKEFWETM